MKFHISKRLGAFMSLRMRLIWCIFVAIRIPFAQPAYQFTCKIPIRIRECLRMAANVSSVQTVQTSNALITCVKVDGYRHSQTYARIRNGIRECMYILNGHS